MKRSHFFTSFFLILILIGCSTSSNQRAFEREAFSFPEGITETDVEGDLIPNRTDPDDWRISPMYRGFIEIQTPAFPNPVSINSTLRIELDITGIETIPGLEVIVFQDPDRLVGPIFTETQTPIPPGFRTIVLNPAQFSSSSNTEQAVGLHRVLILDGRDEVISYGDVRIQ